MISIIKIKPTEMRSELPKQCIGTVHTAFESGLIGRGLLFYRFVSFLLAIQYQQMATLRTAFLERLNLSKNPFFTTAVNLQPLTPQVSNSDDIKKEKKGTSSSQAPAPPNYLQRKPMHNLMGQNCHAINRILNQNINNFSQLMDASSNDFKDCEDFVHVLQLQSQLDQEFRFSELDTLKSVSLETSALRSYSRRHKRSAAQEQQEKQMKFNEDDEEFSEVEDIEPEP